MILSRRLVIPMIDEIKNRQTRRAKKRRSSKTLTFFMSQNHRLYNLYDNLYLFVSFSSFLFHLWIVSCSSTINFMVFYVNVQSQSNVAWNCFVELWSNEQKKFDIYWRDRPLDNNNNLPFQKHVNLVSFFSRLRQGTR